MFYKTYFSFSSKKNVFLNDDTFHVENNTFDDETASIMSFIHHKEAKEKYGNDNYGRL